MVGLGLGAALGTWLFGYIFDVTGAYTIAIVITIITIYVKCIAIWVAAPRKVRRAARKAPKII